MTFAKVLGPLRIDSDQFRSAAAAIAFSPIKNWGSAMPTETAIVIAGIVLVFAVFAVTLAWADFYTRNCRAPGAE